MDRISSSHNLIYLAIFIHIILGIFYMNKFELEKHDFSTYTCTCISFLWQKLLNSLTHAPHAHTHSILNNGSESTKRRRKFSFLFKHNKHKRRLPAKNLQRLRPCIILLNHDLNDVCSLRYVIKMALTNSFKLIKLQFLPNCLPLFSLSHTHFILKYLSKTKLFMFLKLKIWFILKIFSIKQNIL